MAAYPSLDVYTSGENNCLSLGNPLGTSKRKRVHFDTERGSQHFVVDNTVIGSNSTIYMGYMQRPNGRNCFFVSGKFGDKHFMTPKLIETEDTKENFLTIAAVGSAHLIVCTDDNLFFVIGDNSSNQLGCGPAQKFVTHFRRRHLSEINSEGVIIDCVTSKNHTIIQTDGELLVAGTNCGQMGPYATRTFNQPLGPPKSFTRLLSPDDSLNTQSYVRMALADDLTVIYVGSRAKVFFEYNVYSFTLDGSQIQKISICKPNIHFGTTRLLVLTTSAELFVWTKTSGKHLRNPIWSLTSSFPDAIFTFTDHLHFSCSFDGEFFIVHRSMVYSGSLSHDGVDVQRLIYPPGFVQKALISPSGRNIAFLVKRKALKIPDYDEQKLRRNQQIVSKRLGFFNRNQPETPDLSTIRIKAAKQQFTVHQFILRARAPSLLRLVNNGIIILDEFFDETVEAMVEWMYSERCHLFSMAERILELFFRCHKKQLTCDICGKIYKRKKEETNEESSSSTCKGIPYNLWDERDDDWYNYIFDPLERQLIQLNHLADALALDNWPYKNVERILGQMDDPHGTEPEYREVVWSENKSFINPNLSAEHIFVDRDASIRLCCADGHLPCSRSLLCSSVPYFEAFCRWNEGDESSIEVELSGIIKETAEIFVKFLLSHSLDDFQLTIDQMIKLYILADRYGVDELMDSTVDLIRENMHLDELSDIFKLANTFFKPYLDAVLAEFLFVHLPFIYNSDSIISSIPDRVSQLLANKLRQIIQINSNTSETSEPETTDESKKQRIFLERANILLEALLDNENEGRMSAELEEQILNKNRGGRRRRRAEHRQKSNSNSICEPSQAPIAVANESLQFRLSESSSMDPDFPEFRQQPCTSSKWVKMEERREEHDGEINNNTVSQKLEEDRAGKKKGSLNLSWASEVGESSSATVKEVFQLSQIMQEEERQRILANGKAKKEKIKRMTTPVKIPVGTTPSQNRANGSAWGASSISPKSPPPSLMNIQKNELDEIKMVESTPKFKPVQLVEIEEKAIEELTEYYKGVVFGEEDSMLIRVRRAEGPEDEGRRRRRGMAGEGQSPKWATNSRRGARNSDR